MNKAVRPGLHPNGASALVVVIVLVLGGFVFVWRSLAVDSNLSGPPTTAPSQTSQALLPAEDGVVTPAYFITRAVDLLPYFKLAAIIGLCVIAGLILLFVLAALTRRLFYAAKSRVGVASEPLPPLLTYPQGYSASQAEPPEPAPSPAAANPPPELPPIAPPAGPSSVLGIVLAVSAAVGLTTYYAGKATTTPPNSQTCPSGQQPSLVAEHEGSRLVCLPSSEKS